MAVANMVDLRPGETPAAALRRLLRAAEGVSAELALYQDLYQMHLECGWPKPLPQVQFDTTGARRWRFDLAYLRPHLLAVEVDGGVWGRRNAKTGAWEAGARGGHTSGSGFLRDLEKLNEAAVLGWRVVRVTPAMVYDGSAQTLIGRALGINPR